MQEDTLKLDQILARFIFSKGKQCRKIIKGKECGWKEMGICEGVVVIGEG